ncbi:hypothetical protein D9M68_687800 [compost metagenome]
MPRQADPPGLAALALQLHAAATDLLAGHQLKLRLARRQAIELFDQLLQLAQVEHAVRLAGKAHGQLALAGQRGTVQAFETALDHDHLQGATGQVLLR